MQRSSQAISGLFIALVLAACVFSIGARSAEEPKAILWEYKLFLIPQEWVGVERSKPDFPKPDFLGSVNESMGKTFNSFGKEGWELICLEKGTAYFKRPKK